MKKTIAAIGLATMAMVSGAFANDGIIVAGGADLSRDGIIVAGRSDCAATTTSGFGIIVAGALNTGIIVAGSMNTGIIVAGSANTGIIVAGSSDDSGACTTEGPAATGIIVAG